MATLIYTPKENGDLKLLAEIDESLEDGEAVELLLQEAPRTKVPDDGFVVITGTLDSGDVSTVKQQETVTIKWTSSRRNGDGEEETEVPAPRSRRAAAKKDDEEEKPKPARRRQASKPSTQRKRTSTAKSNTAAKPRSRGNSSTAKKPPASRSRSGGSKPASRKPAAKKSGGSPFKRNPASDE